MKKINFTLFILVAVITISSCTKKNDAPTVADNILNYTINEIPVTTDYNVGAIYYNFTTFNLSLIHI
jgi:hypothetical protein